jgi:hypothetical protein
MKMIPARILASPGLHGDRVTEFQWHDICSIHARQTIFQAKNSSGHES